MALKRVLGIALGVLGVCLVVIGAYGIWLGWSARVMGIFAVWLGLVAVLVSYLNTPRRESPPN